MDIPIVGNQHPTAQSGPALTPELKARFEEETTGHDVVLYMKGTPDAPQCGFSARAAGVLQQLGHPFHAVNVFEQGDPWTFIRALHEFADFPTLPQVWVKGQLIGGSDIALDLYESGDLQKLVAQDAT